MAINPFSLDAIKEQAKRASGNMLTSFVAPSTAQASYSPYSSSTPPSTFKPQPIPQVTPSYNQNFAGPGGNIALGSGTNINNQSAPVVPKTAVSTPTTTATAPVAPTTASVPVAPTVASSTPLASISSPGGGSPSIPSIDPSLQSAYDAASKAYEDSLKLGPDELSTQQDLDNLISSTRRAYADIEDKPIAMQFITGQLASVERRANVLSEPLERKLARLQASRTSSIEASKFGLERAEKRMSEAESARRFGLEFGLSQEKQTEDKRQADLAYGLSKEKFEEDKRQFGVQIALENRKLAQTAANKAAEEKTVETEKAQAALDTANLTNQLLQGDYQGITGGILGKSILTRLGTTNQKEVNLFKQIQSKLSLGARQLIKGSGAISDFEAKTLQDSASSLNTNLNNADFKDALLQVRGALMSNAGQAVNVEITDPKTGTKQVVSTNRDGIGEAIKDGLIVKYQ